jgi:hypothetical protein
MLLMSNENGSGQGIGQGAPEGAQAQRRASRHRRIEGATPGVEPGKHRAEAQTPPVSEAQGLAAKIRGLFGRDHDPNVNPHDVLNQVSKGALLEGANPLNNLGETTRRTITGREKLTRSARSWARTQAHQGEIRANYDQLAQEYRQTNKTEPIGDEARRLRSLAVHASRLNEGQRILTQIQDIQGGGTYQQDVSDRQASRILGGRDISAREVRKIKTDAIVSEIRGVRPQEQGTTQVDALAEDTAAQREAMLKSERFKTIRADVKADVLREQEIDSLADAADPTAVLKDIYDRSRAKYAETPAAQPESAVDPADQALERKATESKKEFIDDETIRLYGDGMTYEEARAQALKIAIAEIQNEDAATQAAADLAERDTALVDLRGQLDDDDVTRLTEQDNFDSVFTQELALYGDDPTGREVADAYDRTLGLLHQNEFDIEASIEQEAYDKGEVLKAKQRIIKDTKGIVPADIDILAVNTAIDVVRKNRAQAMEAKGRMRLKEAPVAAGARAEISTVKAEVTTALEDADVTVERAEEKSRKLRPKALLRELGVDIKNETIANILDTLKDPANAELKQAFVGKLSAIQKAKAAYAEEGMDFDAKGEVDKIIASYKEEDGQTPNNELAKKRFLRVLMEFLGAVAVELAKSTLTTSLEAGKAS